MCTKFGNRIKKCTIGFSILAYMCVKYGVKYLAMLLQDKYKRKGKKEKKKRMSNSLYSYTTLHRVPFLKSYRNLKSAKVNMDGSFLIWQPYLKGIQELLNQLQHLPHHHYSNYSTNCGQTRQYLSYHSLKIYINI